MKAVNHRPLTAETRVQSQTSPWEICGERSGAGTGFLPGLQSFATYCLTIAPYVVCSCQYNNTDSAAASIIILTARQNCSMRQYRKECPDLEMQFSCVQNNIRNKNINIEPVEATRRTNRSRVIVNYVGGKLCKFV